MDKIPTTTEIKVIEATPRELPILCPVCHGFGTLKYGSIKCQGCDGKGWVLVPAQEIQTYSKTFNKPQGGDYNV